MNKYKVTSIAAALVMIAAGCVYLAFGKETLAVVLAICVAAICVMGAANAAEIRSQGQKGFVSYIPAVCFFVLAGFVAAAMVYLLI